MTRNVLKPGRRKGSSRFLELVKAQHKKAPRQQHSRRRKGSSRFLDHIKAQQTVAPATTKKPGEARVHERRFMTEDLELNSLLTRCAVDLRARVEREELRPAFNREAEISTVIQLLTSSEHLHPIVLGKARSGKTALAHELARRIVAGDAPESLRELNIYEVSPASLLAGLQFGEGWRANVATLFNKLSELGPVLIFIRDVHAAVGGGVKRGDDDDDDLAAALESSLRDSRIKVIAEARPDRWSAIAADREAFADLFAPLHLPRLLPPDVAEILRQVSERVSARTSITIEPGAQATVLDVAGRFILNQAFPGKAIELLEEAVLLAEREKATRLEHEHIVTTFGTRTGLAKLLLDENEPFDENALRRSFGERVLGQDPAVAAMVQKLALLKARLHDPSRPMGVYFYLGPTGVGKTELAKTLAASLFGSEDRFVRFNMADYSGEFDYAQLFGRSWGDSDAERRGKLTMALINFPFAVLLLDEFEKAHRSIFNRFLQLFDEGLLVNAMGEEVNLRNTIIIMTSNFGASIVQGETWGFSAREGIDAVERRVLRETEEFFSPEFINRLDGVTFFKPLSQSDMRQIAARELRKLFEREGLVRRGVQVELDDAVLDVLLKHGYSIRYGARYLKRQIEKMVTYPLASTLLARPSQAGGLLRLYVAREHIKAAWVTEEDEPLPAPAEDTESGQPKTVEEAAEVVLQLGARLKTLTETLNLLQARDRQAELMAEMSSPSFWDDPANAQLQLADLGEVARRVDRCDDLLRLYDEVEHLLERVRDRRERRMFPELLRVATRMQRELRFAELELCFRTEEDWNDAYVVVESNAAGLRWVRQLTTTYIAWAQSKRLETEVVEETTPDDLQARVTLHISGSGAYGLLKGEMGTHRIAETSGESRQKAITQVLVMVLPVPTETMAKLPVVELDVACTPVHAVGQFLRKLRASARAIHTPTGAAALATAPTERAARELALQLLHARLLWSRLDGPLTAAADPWGSVVRTYHFAKRSYIKDPRTNVTSTNPREVLNGGLDIFIEAVLRERSKDLNASC
ncbi:MAG: AAA family ATPase [Herpetosiphonaceae bacterium]|nr:AAA family ATPase [Herpetosiphonaceae bacterium]